MVDNRHTCLLHSVFHWETRPRGTVTRVPTTLIQRWVVKASSHFVYEAREKPFCTQKKNRNTEEEPKNCEIHKLESMDKHALVCHPVATFNTTMRWGDAVMRRIPMTCTRGRRQCNLFLSLVLCLGSLLACNKKMPKYTTEQSLNNSQCLTLCCKMLRLSPCR